jgi:hypothetical protein
MKLRNLLVAFVAASLLALLLSLVSCSSSRSAYSSNRGLMLLENTQLGRNQALYSKHNNKTLKQGYKQFTKNNRYFKKPQNKKWKK